MRVDETNDGRKYLVCQNDWQLSQIVMNHPNQMLIRNCITSIFDRVANTILGGTNNVMVTGTPGIGKSVAIVDLLHRIITGNRNFSLPAETVLLHIEDYTCIISHHVVVDTDEEEWIKYIFPDTNYNSHSLMMMLRQEFRGPYLYIFDDASFDSHPFIFANIPTIVSARPTEYTLKSF